MGSGKTYLACSIANALIEQYQMSVKIRNFSRIINELQKGGFDLDKNAYIESLVNTSVLILDDLGIAVEQKDDMIMDMPFIYVRR